MGETKDTKARADEGSPAARTRDEQATSSKTLSDLEATQSDAASTATGGGSSSSGTSSTLEGSSPAPDAGADSAHGGRADGSDTGGPM